MIQSIYNGIDARMIKAESKYVADRIEELEAEDSKNLDKPPSKPLVHPTLANRYRLEVENLRQALDRKNARAEASDHLRGLIGKIVLTPEPGREDLRIDLHGDLAGILQIASQKQVRPGNKTISGPNKIALVAGAGLPSPLRGSVMSASFARLGMNLLRRLKPCKPCHSSKSCPLQTKRPAPAGSALLFGSGGRI